MKWLALWLYAFLFLVAMGLVSADPEGWMNDTRITFDSFIDSYYPSLATDPQDKVHVLNNGQKITLE